MMATYHRDIIPNDIGRASFYVGAADFFRMP